MIKKHSLQPNYNNLTSKEFCLINLPSMVKVFPEPVWPLKIKHNIIKYKIPVNMFSAKEGKCDSLEKERC